MSAKDELVEMLSTWSAVEHPRFGSIFAVFRERLEPGRTTLQRVLQQVADELPVEILAQIRHALGHEPAAALVPLERRVEDELRPRVEDRRRHLVSRFQDVQVHLEPAAVVHVLRSVWQSEDDSSLDAMVNAFGSLSAAEHVLQDWLELTRAELQRLVENGHQHDLESSIVFQARAALESSRPVEIVAAQDALRRTLARTEATALEQTAVDTRRRLEVALTEAGALVERGEFEGDAGILVTLTSVLEQAQQALATPAPPVVLGGWADHIGTLLGGAMERGAAARAARHQLAQRLGEGLAQALERHPEVDEGLRARRDEALSQKIRDLEQAAIAGGPGFDVAVEQCTAELRALRKEVGRAVEVAVVQLQKARAELSELLSRAAKAVPSRLVVECRLRLEQVPSTIASADPKLIRSLEAAIRRDLETLNRVAQDVHQTHRNRREALRERLSREIERFLPLATRGLAKRLVALRARLDGDDAADPERIGESLEAALSAIERRLRLRVCRKLALASGWLARRKGSTLSHVLDLEKSAVRARQALEEDDLPALAQADEALLHDLRGAVPLQRPRVRIAAACGTAAVLLLAAFATAWWLNRPYSVDLTFTGDTSGQHELWLVGDDDLFIQEESLELAKPYRARLTEGHWEVFLDQKFTGVAFEATEDADIEVPVP